MKLRKKITFRTIKNAFIGAIIDTKFRQNEFCNEQGSSREEEHWLRMELMKNGCPPSLKKLDETSIEDIKNLKNG